jgi:hypothetical protein
MAGPVVRILVQASALPVEPAIALSLEKVGLRPDGEDLFDGDDLSYGLTVEPPNPEIDVDIVAALDPTGFRPSQAVLLIAYVNDDRAHRLLGELAADFATYQWMDRPGAHGPSHGVLFLGPGEYSVKLWADGKYVLRFPT